MGLTLPHAARRVSGPAARRIRTILLIGLWACVAGLPLGALARAKADRHGEDRFGGLPVRVAPSSGYFHVQKIGDRWIFVTPDGDPFWMRSVYTVDLGDGGRDAEEALKVKYHSDMELFGENAVRRLLSWGFNTVGEYSTLYACPLPTYFHPHGDTQQMAFIRLLNISWYGSLDFDHLAPAPFKTLLAGAVDPQVYKGWAGHVPDPFDPNFAIYARNSAGDLKTVNKQVIFTENTDKGGLPNPSLDKTPWLLATEPDDADYVFGFGPGSQEPGSDGAIHPHLGWVVAVTKPMQTDNQQVGAVFGSRHTITYSDPVVYAKKAWHDYLVQKYRTIQALNAAWGSRYTTFDSDGGWPMGRGLMDESGRNPWMGDDPEKLSKASPGAVADLDVFLGIFADQYFRVTTEAIRAATPRQLIFTPTLDSHGGMSRPQILQAAARYADVIQVNFDPQRPGLLAKTYQLTGKPMFSWLGIRANQDSPLRDSGNPVPGPRTQADRGSLYAQNVQALFALAAPGGDHPVVGIDWWEYMDKVGEKSNWGLVTPKDNAYDGKEDVVAAGTDPWGFPTGREVANFGDFLTDVAHANAAIDQQLAGEMRGAGVSRASGPRQKGQSKRP